jgi:hypothetical protein
MTSYIESVIWTILRASFTKKSFCYVLISLTTLIVRSHIDAILGFLLKTPYSILNIIIHIIVSVTLIIKTKYIYDIVQRYEPEFYNIVRYLINNYTEKNFKRWKLKLNLSVCIYIYILTFITTFSNESIRQIIIEYLICYFLIEFYEKYTTGKIHILKTKEYECLTKDEEIINNLIKNTESIQNKIFK